MCPKQLKSEESTKQDVFMGQGRYGVQVRELAAEEAGEQAGAGWDVCLGQKVGFRQLQVGQNVAEKRPAEFDKVHQLKNTIRSGFGN